MRIATEYFKSYHRHQDEKKENELLSEGMERLFGKPWYECDGDEAEKKRKEKGL